MRAAPVANFWQAAAAAGSAKRQPRCIFSLHTLPSPGGGAASTYCHGQLVGKPSPPGPPERRMLPMMGKQKAAVLPEPVWAQAIMSRPASPMGME